MRTLPNDILRLFATVLHVCFDSSWSSVEQAMEVALEKISQPYNTLLPGRLGPHHARIQNLHANAEMIPQKIFPAQFISLRGNMWVSAGRWMYEVVVHSNPRQLQVGWSTIYTPYSDESGVGNSPDSYAYNGATGEKCNGTCFRIGELWAVGDVIGCLLDCDEGTITYYCNGKKMDVVFQIDRYNAYCPTISLGEGDACFMNLGTRPLCHPVSTYRPLSSEGELQESIRSYLMTCFQRTSPFLTGNGTLQSGEQVSSGAAWTVFGTLWRSFLSFFEEATQVVPFLHQLLKEEARDGRVEQFAAALCRCNMPTPEWIQIVRALFERLSEEVPEASWDVPHQGPAIPIGLAATLLRQPDIAIMFKNEPELLDTLLNTMIDVTQPSEEELVCWFSPGGKGRIVEDNVKEYIRAVEHLVCAFLCSSSCRVYLLRTIQSRHTTAVVRHGVVFALLPRLKKLSQKSRLSLLVAEKTAGLIRVGGSYNYLQRTHPISADLLEPWSELNLYYHACIVALERVYADMPSRKKYLGLSSHLIKSLLSWDLSFWYRRQASQWETAEDLNALISSASQIAPHAIGWVPELYYEVMVKIVGTISQHHICNSSTNDSLLTSWIDKLIVVVYAKEIRTLDIKAKAISALNELTNNLVGRSLSQPPLVGLVDHLILWSKVQSLEAGCWGLFALLGQRHGFGRSDPAIAEYHSELARINQEQPERVEAWMQRLFASIAQALGLLRKAISVLPGGDNDLFFSIINHTRIRFRVVEIVARICPRILTTNRSQNLVPLAELIITLLYTMNSEKYRQRTSSRLEVSHALLLSINGLLVTLHDVQTEDGAPRLDTLLAQKDGPLDTKFDLLTQIPMQKEQDQLFWERDVARLEVVVKTIVASYRDVESKGEEEEENTCTICCALTIDARMMPCRHEACRQCITRCLNQQQVCFYCRGTVTDVVDIFP